MQFRTTGKETLSLNMKKWKILGAIIINKLEIQKLDKIQNFLFTYYRYNDEKFSFKVLLVKSRCASVHDDVFNIW